MNIPQMYGYLQRARRDLWAALEALPDEVLSKPVLAGERFHCIKDLMFHIAAVEDGWVNEDIRGEPPVRLGFPALDELPWEPVFAQVPLPELLRYWKAVEADTLRYLATLTEQDGERIVALHDAPDERYTVDSLLLACDAARGAAYRADRSHAAPAGHQAALA